jgi:hypothetical protein
MRGDNQRGYVRRDDPNNGSRQERHYHGKFACAPWLSHSIPVGSIGAYYPETNPLLPLAYHDLKSGTPAAKSIPVLVRPQAPELASGN